MKTMFKLFVVVLVTCAATPALAEEPRRPKQERREPSFHDRMVAAFLRGWGMHVPQNSPQRSGNPTCYRSFGVPGARATVSGQGVCFTR